MTFSFGSIFPTEEMELGYYYHKLNVQLSHGNLTLETASLKLTIETRQQGVKYVQINNKNTRLTSLTLFYFFFFLILSR